MRVRSVLLLALSVALAREVLAQQPKGAPKPAAARPVFMQPADLKWVALDPTAPGIMIADLWGNHAKGAYGAFIKFPAGFSAPLHTHTYTMKLVILSGTFIHGPEGKPQVRLGPGSYFLQPGGNYRHTTACDPASECLFFAESSGEFDLKPVAAGKAPAKKP